MRTLVFLIFAVLVAAQPQLNPLAGIGYMGMTINPLTYAKGQNIFNTSQMCTTPDGKWQIVCGMSANPVLQTNINIVSTSQSSASDFSRDATSDVAVSASAGWGIFKASGSYSQTSTSMVDIMTSNDCSLVLSRVEMQLYQLNSNKITMPLNGELIQYINILGTKLANNDIKGYTTWMTDFISNFPPGIIDSGISGARLEQINYVANSYYHSTNTQTVQNCASASVSFGSIFSANGHDNWGVTTSQVATYTSNVQQYTVNSVGGVMEQGMNVSQWQDSAVQNPALLSYTMDLSLYWLTPEVLAPYVTATTDQINQIQNDYIATYANYLEKNSYYGCTNPYGSNFNKLYNVDNGACDYNYTTASYFGGVYSISTVYNAENGQQLSQTITPNMYTGVASCPTGSWAHCSTYTYPSDYVCITVLKKTVCEYVTKVTNIICSCDGDSRYAPVNPAFGGLYFGTTANPVTNGFSCPPSFSQTGPWCLGIAVPSAKYNGIYQIYNGGCNVANSYTGACSCPSGSYPPVLLQLSNYNDGHGTIWAYASYVCIGQPPFIIGANDGNAPTLTPLILISNFSGNTTQEPTSEPTSTPSHTKMPVRDIWFIVLGVIGGLVIIAGGLVYLKYRRFNQTTYTTIL